MSSPIAKLEFTNADGDTFDFLASWVNITRLIGFEGGEASHRRIESPLEDGSSYLNTRKLDMMPAIQFEIEGLTWAQMTARRRMVMSVLRPKSGLGVFRFQPHSTSDEYEIDALVERRAGRDRVDSYSQLEVWTVQWRCPDPFWHIAPSNDEGLEAGGYRTIDNAGDDESWPVVTITPDSVSRSPFIHNLTTGQLFSLDDLSVQSTEELVIDMDERTVQVDGVDLATNLIPINSEFWVLAYGENEIVGSPGAQLCGTGANDGGAGTAWGNPNDITDDTTADAVVNLTTTTSSQLLLATNLGLSAPSDATISGVRVIFHGRRNSSNVRAVVIQLWNGSSLIGDNRGGTSIGLLPVAPADDGMDYVTEGAYDDLWGATLTHTIVNNSGFGVALRMQNQISSTTQTQMRSIYVEVFWTEPDGTPGSQVAIVYPTRLDGV